MSNPRPPLKYRRTDHMRVFCDVCGRHLGYRVSLGFQEWDYSHTCTDCYENAPDAIPDENGDYDE
jgi:hypothetical protein